MKMTTRIAYNNIKYYKSKNILIGIAIFLTTLLLFLIPTIGTNIVDGQCAAVNEIYPTWHALFRDVDDKTVKKLSAHHDIAVSGLQSDAGYMVSENAKIAMLYMDEEGLSLYRIKLSEGRAPEKENEIVVSPGTLEELGKEGKVGDVIRVPYQIFQQGGLGFKEEKEFVISGILEDDDAKKEQKVYSAFISKEFLENEVSHTEISYRFLFRVNGKKDALTDEIEVCINSIAKQFAIGEKNIAINKDYLMANYVDPTMVPIIMGIMVIIVLAGVITIFSIYYVGMTNRIQEYGKLKAIGATKSQMRQIVLKEGFGVALLAIPAGLIIGSILSKLLFLGFLSSYQDENTMVITMKQLLEKKQFSLYHWWIYLLTIVVVLFTIYLSHWRPMKIIAGISEMEAIRYQPLDARGKNKRKSFFDINISKLSYIYLFGNKKNSIITIASMGITGAFLMIVATVLSCANPRESANNDIWGQYDISLNVETGNKEHPEREWRNIIKNNPLNHSLIKKIEAVDGIKSVSSFGAVDVRSKVFEGESMGVCGIPKSYSKRLLEGITQGKASYEDLKTGEKVIVDKNLLHWYPNIKLGDTLDLTVLDGSRGQNKKVKIVAIGDYPIGFTYGHSILMAEEGAKKLCDYNINEVYHIFATKDYDENTEKALKELVASSEHLQLRTWKEQYDEWKSGIATISGASYAFLGVLGVICVMNMINTMINSVHVRKKEIGMLQAIGMTNGQLVRMLMWESLFYTSGTLIFSVGMGSVLGYQAYLWAKYNGMFSIRAYHYPVMVAIVISIVLIFIQVVLIISLGKSVRKESLIERIRFSD